MKTFDTFYGGGKTFNVKVIKKSIPLYSNGLVSKIISMGSQITIRSYDEFEHLSDNYFTIDSYKEIYHRGSNFERESVLFIDIGNDQYVYVGSRVILFTSESKLNTLYLTSDKHGIPYPIITDGRCIYLMECLEGVWKLDANGLIRAIENSWHVKIPQIYNDLYTRTKSFSQVITKHSWKYCHENIKIFKKHIMFRFIPKKLHDVEIITFDDF